MRSNAIASTPSGSATAAASTSDGDGDDAGAEANADSPDPFVNSAKKISGAIGKTKDQVVAMFGTPGGTQGVGTSMFGTRTDGPDVGYTYRIDSFSVTFYFHNGVCDHLQAMDTVAIPTDNVSTWKPESFQSGAGAVWAALSSQPAPKQVGVNLVIPNAGDTATNHIMCLIGSVKPGCKLVMYVAGPNAVLNSAPVFSTKTDSYQTTTQFNPAFHWQPATVGGFMIGPFPPLYDGQFGFSVFDIPK